MIKAFSTRARESSAFIGTDTEPEDLINEMRTPKAVATDANDRRVRL